MKEFLQQHGANVIGVLRGWDRLRLRGTLRCVAFAAGLEAFLARSRWKLAGFGRFAEWSTTLLRESAQELTRKAERPWKFLQSPGISKEDVAAEIASHDQVKEGLVCTLSALEPCWTFRLVSNKGKLLGVRRSYGKCLAIYQYHQHREFGLMHLRLQTWMPFGLHVCINGREWLSRQMDAIGMRYLKKENCFVWLEDVAKAQELMSRQVGFYWEKELAQMAGQMVPVIGQVLEPYEASYYWSMEQSEWATDVMFRSSAALSEVYPGLLRHAMENFSCREVMRFLGQRVPVQGNAHPRDCREIFSDIRERPEGLRIKHRLGENSVKLYNKQGSIARIETTLNDVRHLKTPRRVKDKVVWKPMRKSVADARRRARLSDQCNERYAKALALMVPTQPLKDLTDGLSARTELGGQKMRGLNLLCCEDSRLLEIVGQGQFLLLGFRNRDIRDAWFSTAASDEKEAKRRSGQIGRKLRLLRAHGLIQKLPHTHRYMVSDRGRQVLATLIAVRNASVAQLNKAA